MAQTKALIKTLKQSLKDRRITYAELANKLDMSEANVKRLFSTGNFSLQRIEDICHVMQMEMSDLFLLYEESRKRIRRLTLEQEKELVSNTTLLLVAVSVRNHLRFDEIIEQYDITPTECIRHLAKLDKLKIIDLLPENRIKLRIDEHFHWIKKGPIEQFFERQIQDQFLRSDFNGDLEKRIFQFGLLSDAATQIMIGKMEALVQEFTDLHCQDLKLPLKSRNNIGFFLTLRPWNLEVFKPYIHQKD